MRPGLLILVAGPALLIPLAVYAIRQRRVRGAGWYGTLLLTLALWSLAYAWELSTESFEVKKLALRVKYLGVLALPPAWVGFILAFVGSESARIRRVVRPMALASGVLLALAWSDGWHQWFWGAMTMSEVGGYRVLVGRGPLFWLNVAYAYGSLIGGMVLLVLHAVHSPYLYKKRAVILIVGTLLPWAGNLVFVLGHEQSLFDPTPFLFSCTAIICALAVFRYRLFEPAPTLRDARIESVGDGVVILDRARRVADSNRAAERILGRTRPEAAGVLIGEVLREWPAGPLPAAPFDLVIDGGAGRRTYDVRCSEVQSPSGEMAGAVVILRDVTDRRLADAAVRESEQRYRAVIEQAFDGVWLADASLTIIDVNPMACMLLGYAREDLIGRRVVDLLDSEERPRVPVAARAAGLQDGGIWERRLIARDGHRVLVAGRSRVIAPGLVVSTFRDITLERAEADLRERLLADAQAANKVKDEFLATVSHELRTPLNAVVGWAHMLVRGRVEPSRVPHALRVIERNALAQARLVDDLLDTSRMADGRMRLAVEDTDVATLVRQAVDAIGPSASSKRLLIEVSLPPGPIRIVADPERLQQVIGNLLSNAIKFTPEGGVITVSVATSAAVVSIAMRDTGLGIDPAFLPRVFDPFTQADRGATRTVPGLGLGLAIVRHITEAHGGWVEAASGGRGCGATFTVHLPIAGKAAGSATPAADVDYTTLQP